jgi:hypothetical protein
MWAKLRASDGKIEDGRWRIEDGKIGVSILDSQSSILVFGAGG